ncbi:hypothetical protein [Mucilaginibacter gotjawali]|uniref:Uncharacterized protein n=2 Tax=Mucilaginibacter gotjawali TaxID=1550579 RepID=A0A839SAK7_9SPHI|nr:hypothetical protein [Mucilaginibacter gotjawali]MBB3055085.1 hypothetical protein [Mucilaginibacter gotjawali]BAU56298.1 hypothetical protein MgSA37_04495 [Mucilaginibacter gotjawali]
MEELVIKVKDEKESSFLKDLLKKLKIKFEAINVDDVPSGEQVKQTVLNGQKAYRNGDLDQFKEINPKDLWK